MIALLSCFGLFAFMFVCTVVYLCMTEGPSIRREQNQRDYSDANAKAWQRLHPPETK